MAKSLLKHSDFTCTSLEVEEGDVAPLGCEMIPLLMDIINTQNLQIIDMESVLEMQRAPMYADCEVESLGELQVGRKMQDEAAPTGVYEHGIECRPCANITEVDCEVTVKVDFFTSELGEYHVCLPSAFPFTRCIESTTGYPNHLIC